MCSIKRLRRNSLEYMVLRLTNVIRCCHWLFLYAFVNTRTHTHTYIYIYVIACEHMYITLIFGHFLQIQCFLKFSVYVGAIYANIYNLCVTKNKVMVNKTYYNNTSTC